MDKKNWFKIEILLGSSEEEFFRLCFSPWKMEPLDFNKCGNYEIIWPYSNRFKQNRQFEQNGNKLEAMQHISCRTNNKWDIFIRRGAGFTQFRHFKINQEYFLSCDHYYIDFLIAYISNSKHPEDFLESIEANLQQQTIPSLHQNLLNFIFVESIPEGGKLVEFDNKKLHILSAKIANPKNKWLRSSSGTLEFTLANGPTNGEYVFDIVLQFINGFKKIVGIKIQKRKIGDVVELKCKNQIELGRKRKASNDNGEDDGPTCSNKIMKK